MIKLSWQQKYKLLWLRLKIQCIGWFSPLKAATIAFQFLTTPFTKITKKSAKKMPLVFDKAQVLAFQFQDIKMKGWCWKMDNDSSKKVLIVHGFDSAAYHYEQFVQPLLDNGYMVFSFDAPAHGQSEGKQINVVVMSRVIAALDQYYGSFYGIIAHSFGGLSAALALEKIPALQKLVLIAPTTETTRTLKSFFFYIPLSKKVKKAFYQYIENKFNLKIEAASVTKCLEKTPVSTLWLHDRKDKICLIEDLPLANKMHYPHIQFVITEGLGHNRICKEKSSIHAIIEFLKVDKSP